MLFLHTLQQVEHEYDRITHNPHYILMLISIFIDKNWEYFPFIILIVAACVMFPLTPPTTYILAEVTDAPFVEVVQKYELFSAREEEGIYVFKVKSNE